LREITGFQKYLKMRDINVPESMEIEAETTVRRCENLGEVQYGPAVQLKKIWRFAEFPAPWRADIPGLVEVDFTNIEQIMSASWNSMREFKRFSAGLAAGHSS
jgi:hypothetical protein